MSPFALFRPPVRTSRIVSPQSPDADFAGRPLAPRLPTETATKMAFFSILTLEFEPCVIRDARTMRRQMFTRYYDGRYYRNALYILHLLHNTLAIHSVQNHGHD